MNKKHTNRTAKRIAAWAAVIGGLAIIVVSVTK